MLSRLNESAHPGHHTTKRRTLFPLLGVLMSILSEFLDSDVKKYSINAV